MGNAVLTETKKGESKMCNHITEIEIYYAELVFVDSKIRKSF